MKSALNTHIIYLGTSSFQRFFHNDDYVFVCPTLIMRPASQVYDPENFGLIPIDPLIADADSVAQVKH